MLTISCSYIHVNNSQIEMIEKEEFVDSLSLYTSFFDFITDNEILVMEMHDNRR